MADIQRHQLISPNIIDQTGVPPRQNEFWEPLIATKEMMDSEVARLLSVQAPNDGRRCSTIAHPKADSRYPALAPGIRVTLNVLKPGERTNQFRHNATEVNFCIRGSGVVIRGTEATAVRTYDVWNMPSFTWYSHTNDGNEPLVWLSYSNVPLLQYMQVHITEADYHPVEIVEEEDRTSSDNGSPFGTLPIGGGGALLMPYEQLINPAVVTSEALHWPWTSVEQELRKLEKLGKSYAGRRLYLLYNPATGRTNGTTQNLFATMTIRPRNVIDRPHRHVSASINYFFEGSGQSTVAGKRYRWKAGDLMLTAPGWAIHNHSSKDESVYEMTVQDQPLTIAMDALLWQEDLKSPPILLGSHSGFETNRSQDAGG